MLASCSSLGAFDHLPCGLVERVLQGGFEPAAFGDLDQRPQVRLDHAGERLQPLAEQQRVVVALAVEHADRAEHLAAGPFQGIADVEAHPVGQILVGRPDRVAGRVLDHQLAVVFKHALAIEHGVQVVLAPDIVGVALGAATHQDRVFRTLGLHDQARRHPGEPCRQVDHALPLGQRLGRDLG